MTSYTSSELLAIVIQLVIVLLIARRSYQMTLGVSYSIARLALLPIVIGFLWLLNVLGALALVPGWAPYLIAVDLAILLGAAAAFTPIAERRTVILRHGSDGSGEYRIGFSITVVFLVAFLLRLVLAIALFPQAFVFGAPVGTLPYAQALVLAVIDALFSLSAGLLVGRSLGIHRRWKSSPVAPSGSTAS